ncbi:MAG: CPBP family intramembrane metalloprotease [Chlamydiia bacterium]|nr:CPBP family intramembrane metalloprotease [Chlamydiia bacterium]
MHNVAFTLKTFLAHPLVFSTYGVLMLSFLSMWVHKRVWIWAPLILASIIIAFLAKVIDDKALVSIALLLGCHLCLRPELKGPLRLILVTLASVISLGLLFHFMPGFNNWLIVKDMHVSPDGYPFTLYFNYDKPFIGIFVLGFNLALLSSWQEWKPKLLSICFWIALTILAMMGLSLLFNTIHFDPKFPPITLPWLLSNIFLVCIPEEAFWRGFLQREITNGFQDRTKWAPAIAIISISGGFALMHIFFVPHIAYIFLVFVASALYGMAYHFTKSIECAILVHFLLNLTQFFFFTYPALA